MIKCDICGNIGTTHENYFVSKGYGFFTYYDAVLCERCLHTLFALVDNPRYNDVEFVRKTKFEETDDGLIEIFEPSKNCYYTRYDRMVDNLIPDERECECGGIMIEDYEYNDNEEYLYPIFVCLNCGRWVYDY